MKLTTSWLKEHLDTRLNENQIIDKLTEIGLEVENLENQPSKKDTLKVCDVDIGQKNFVKVVCGAQNARKDLLTIYAPPGSIVPKSEMKLEISKIRGVT